ncbi:AGAP011028-PA-like protein [Anopheles sinensis]|uniref:AGAP011028-PA-like protein n=1 Tax=Anopheles sinensis TaxID=74873 RepID=A0A084W969_ANOSI|nr:AGAP011028-PA-like protein [Anopheles sinensis]
MALHIGLLLLGSIFALLYALIVQRYRYWKIRNIPTLPASFPLGNFGALRRLSPAEVSTELYRQMDPKERFYGLFMTLKPAIMITDLDLIKTVLIKDFSYFPDHGIYHNERVDPLSAHLFCLEGAKWKSIRSKLSPTFTSGRMKAMFPILHEVAGNFRQYLQTQLTAEPTELDLKDCCARMMIDNIGGCASGIECNSFREPNSAFRRSGQLVFDSPRYSQLVTTVLRLYPAIGHALGLKMHHDEVIEFFTELVRDTIAMRERSVIKRDDLLNTMIELKSATEAGLTMDELTAQAFGFFLAGYETSSSNITFCLYELALNEECQERARACVLEALRKHGGLTYEAVADMEYLDRCINETLRKYPPLPVLHRLSCKPYRLPGTDVILPAKTKVLIPVYAIQRDERYYPDPERFDPDRFAPEEVAKRHFSTFLSFGEGPRICIGQRLGVMQSRVGLATLLANFRFRPGPSTPIPLVYAKDAVTLQNNGPVRLLVEPL